MAKQQPNLADLANSAGSARKKPIPEPQPEQQAEKPEQQKGRQHAGLAAITVHFPRQVRQQLKSIATDHDRSMQSVIAEAYNDFFAKYGKPEIAPKE